jgi:acetyltransferase-like isoleucine patch superfamily enzyme
VNDGYELVNYVSPYSICFDNVLVGKNILISDNVYVGPGCKIHDGVFILVGSTLSHDDEVDAYTFISVRVAFGGYAKVKNNCFIGLNSTIRDSVVIEEYNIVGCGANVIKSTLPNSVTVGNPGKSVVKDTKNMKI